MNAHPAPELLRKGDWIRFQIQSNRIVLEGFILEISPDHEQIRVGHAPDSVNSDWYPLSGIKILKQQHR